MPHRGPVSFGADCARAQHQWNFSDGDKAKWTPITDFTIHIFHQTGTRQCGAPVKPCAVLVKWLLS